MNGINETKNCCNDCLTVITAVFLFLIFLAAFKIDKIINGIQDIGKLAPGLQINI